MGRYLKLLAEARAKRAKEGTTKGTTEVGLKYDDTPLVVSVVSVVGAPAQNEGKLRSDYIVRNKNNIIPIKPKKWKKANDINGHFSEASNGTSALPPRVAPGYDRNDKNDQSPFWDAFVELREACQNVALNHKYIMALADATIFLRDWGAQAEALGWAAEDLFGLDPVAPLGRYDAMGLLWMLEGQRVVALTDEAATIKASSGSLLKFYRRDVSHKWAQRVSDRSAG